MRIRAGRWIHDLSGPTWARAFLFAVPSLLVYVVAHLAMWPAQMTADSFTQWKYLTRGHPTDLHSGLHFAIMKLVTCLWPSPAAVVLLQYVFLAVVTGLVLDELRRWSVPLWAVVLTAVGFPLFPANLFLSTVLWIDVPYAAALALCWYFLLVIVRTRGDALERWSVTLRFAAALSLVALLRTNGMVAAALIALSVAAVHGRALRAFGVSVALVLAVKAVLYPALGIGPFPKAFSGIPPLHIVAAYVSRGHLPAGSDLSLVESITSIGVMQSTYRCEFETLFYREDTSIPTIDRNLRRLWLVALRLVVAKPSIYVEHLLCVTELLWKPLALSSPVMGWPPLAIDPPELDFRPVLPTLHTRLREVFDWTTDESRLWAFWRPAIPLYFIIGATALLAASRRRVDMLLLAAPAIATTLSMAFVIVVPAYRYQYGVAVLGLLSWPLVLARSPK